MSIPKCCRITATRVLLMGSLAVLTPARPAAAHRMEVTCRLIGPKEVRIEASYGEDEPVAGAVVRMLAPDGERLGESETDAAGTCRFLLNEIGEYTFEVVHSGHRGTCSLTQDRRRESTHDAAIGDVKSEHHQEKVSGGVTGIVAGLGFILGLFAFVLVLGQRKEIQRLRAELDKERSGRS